MTEQNRFSEMMGDVGGRKSDTKSDAKSESKTSKRLDGHKAEPASKKRKESSTETSNKAPYRKKYEQPVLRGQLFSKGKSRSHDYDKVTVYIHSKIAHALRVVSAVDKMEMSQIVEDAVLEALMNSPIGKATLEQPDD